MKVLVTGANGFVGSHLVDKLVSRGDDVICLARLTSDLRWLNGLHIDIVFGDITDEASLAKAVRGVHQIYHLAAVTKARERNAYYRVNVDGTRSLLQACVAENRNVQKFIHVSSLAAAGPCPNGCCLRESDPPHPLTDYGMSKLRGEELAIQYMEDLPISILRPPVVYGPRDVDLLMLFRLLNRGIKPILGGKKRLISICHVSDIVQACLLAGASERAQGEIYFLSGKESCSWEEIEDAMAIALGTKPVTVRIPEPAVHLVASLSELVARATRRATPLTRQKAEEMVQPHWICDASKVRDELGYEPQMGLEEGMRETVRWYKEQGWL